MPRPGELPLRSAIVLGGKGGTGSDGVYCASPDPTQYYSADSQIVETTGRPMSAIVGRRATIIPRANRGGTSLGLNPHAPKINKVRVIDGVEPENSFELDLNRVTPALASQSIETVVTAVEPPADEDGEHLLRLGICYALKQLSQNAPLVPRDPTGRPLAAATGEDHEEGNTHMRFGKASQAPLAAPRPAVSESQPVQLAPPSAPVWETRGQERPARGGLSLFGLKEEAREAAPAGRPVLEERPAVQSIAEPQYRVYFDFGQGDIATPFHDVVIEPPRVPNGAPQLVLVYDNRYRGMKYIPVGDPRPFSVYVEGTDVVHLVEWVGVQFTRGHETFTVYAITQSKQR